MGMQYLMILLLFLGGGPTSGNDLLDMVPTNAYWQAKHIAPTIAQLERDAGTDKPPANVDKLIKDLGADDFKTRTDARIALAAMGPAISPLVKPSENSKDPEVASAATLLVKEFTEHGQARSVRRLMAIRTLGERQEKAALPLLKSLVDSRELFVSDYALRAVAQIEGHPLARIDHHKEIRGDLQLLPKATGIVLQATGLPGAALTLDKLVDQAADPANQNQMMGPMNNGKPLDKKKMLARVTHQLLDVIERVGNLRIDAVTVGVAQDAGPNGGWAVVALRGKYDSAAMAAALKTTDDEAKSSQDGKINILDIGEDMTVLLPSDDQLIFIPASGGPVKAPIVENVRAVLKGGQGSFDDNTQVAALMKGVDTAAPAWAVALLNADMRKEQPFEAFDTITLTSKTVKDSLTFTLTGQGANPEKIKAAAEGLTADIQSSILQMKAMVAQMKSLQPIVDVLESMKVTPTDKTATLTGEVKPAAAQAILTAAAPMVWMEMSDGDDDAPDTEILPAPGSKTATQP